MLKSNIVSKFEMVFTKYRNIFDIESNIIKGKIQHDKTFAAAAAIATAINLNKFKFNMCKVAKLKQDYRVAKN